jgi:hypothetical protein
VPDSRLPRSEYVTRRLIFTIAAATLAAAVGIKALDAKDDKHQAAIHNTRAAVLEAMGVTRSDGSVDCSTGDTEISAVSSAYGAALKNLLEVDGRAGANLRKLRFGRSMAVPVQGYGEYMACAVVKRPADEEIALKIEEVRAGLLKGLGFDREGWTIGGTKDEPFNGAAGCGTAERLGDALSEATTKSDEGFGRLREALKMAPDGPQHSRRETRTGKAGDTTHVACQSVTLVKN